MRLIGFTLLLGVLAGCGERATVVNLEGIGLTLDGRDWDLATSVNACVVDVRGETFNTGAELPPDDRRQLLLTFSGLDGAPDWSPLGRHQTFTAVELGIKGGYDLADLDDGRRQEIVPPAPCEVDISYMETVELVRGNALDRYEIAFRCPLVPYTILERSTSEATGGGELTDVSGTYECYMTVADFS